MNKELEETKDILENIKDSIDCDSKENMEFRQALESAINHIENSIPKEKIKKKIEEYKEIADEDNRDFFIRIETLEELLDK